LGVALEGARDRLDRLTWGEAMEAVAGAPPVWSREGMASVMGDAASLAPDSHPFAAPAHRESYALLGDPGVCYAG
jgi:hypothetical protein